MRVSTNYGTFKLFKGFLNYNSNVEIMMAVQKTSLLTNWNDDQVRIVIGIGTVCQKQF